MKKINIEIKIVGGFALALILLLLAFGQMYRSIHGYIETTKWIAHTNQVLDTLSDIRSRLREKESEQRAYLISGEKFYLANAPRDTSLIRSRLSLLSELTLDNSRQQLRILRLTQLTEERLALLDKTILTYSKDGFAAARRDFNSQAGYVGMEAFLKLVSAMETEERSVLAERSLQAELNANQTIFSVVLLVAGALAGLILLWWGVRRQVGLREMSNAALHHNELLKQILELLPVGVLVADASGKLTQINPAARKIWGAEQQSDSLDQFGDNDGWWPATGKRLAADEWALARTLKNGATIRDELIDIRCFDGVRKTISCNAMPIRDGNGRIIAALAVNVDITEFKRTEQQLRAAARFDETQGRAVALFSSSFERRKILDGLLALLAELHPLPVSALYGFDEWTGRFRCEASHGLGAEVPREFALGEGLLGQAAQSGRTSVLDSEQLILQTGLADLLPIQVMMIPVSFQERRLAVLVLASSRALNEGDCAFLERLAITLGVALDNLRQYSDLKQLADQLRTSSEEIELKNIQLEEASRLKSEFLANMSHELRTPLNAIIGFSEVLKDGLMGKLTVQQSQYINDIFDSGVHLLSLINDILDLSKVEAGKMSIELEPLQAADLLESGLQVIREKAMAHSVHLSSEISADLGDVWLDARKFKQILYNLLSNAVKFTAEGGEVHVAIKRVWRDLLLADNFAFFLELTVRDSGIGISAADQALLFQPFVQIDSTLARRYEGTGLGLAMVKRLAELHGGAVALESTPGVGSTFTVWLPWRTENDGDLPTAVNLSNKHPGPGRLAVNTVSSLALVIEDDDMAAELLRIELENFGFRVLRAVSAEAALVMVSEESPDLITLDIRLPGMDGWEFLKTFKQNAKFAGVPVIIVSIVAEELRGIALGASQVLQKPVARELLMRALAAEGFGPELQTGRRSVLVIDDDPKALQLLSTYLVPAGYKVYSAFGGQEGIDMAQRQHPDLIVLDLMMPRVSGFDVVSALKLDPVTADIPVIVVTSKQISAADRERLNGDVNRVIEKSDFKHGTFIQEVKRAMSKKGS